MKKHILVISQYFYPENFRINDICTEWIKRGYKVTVITGIPNYPQGRFFKDYGLFNKRREVYNNIDVIRIPLVPRGSNSLMLVLNYLSFVVSGYFWQAFTKIKADYVFIFEVSPMTQALPGVWYAKKNKIPCNIYVQDLWPENIEVVTGIKNTRILGFIGRLVDYIYANCDKIFTTSKSFVSAINSRGVDLRKIEYWPQYAEDFYAPVIDANVFEIPNDNVFNIIFAGNIGSAQGLEILPNAAEILKINKDIRVRFNIVGDGRYKNEFRNIVKDKQVEEMFNFIQKQPANRIPEYLSACDVAFLSLTNNPIFSMTIPAKLQSYMACGMPIIASADGETLKILNESCSGLCSKPGDAQELVENIIKLAEMSKSELKQLGTNARNYYESNFDKNTLLNIMDIHFNNQQ